MVSIVAGGIITLLGVAAVAIKAPVVREYDLEQALATPKPME